MKRRNIKCRNKEMSLTFGCKYYLQSSEFFACVIKHGTCKDSAVFHPNLQ